MSNYFNIARQLPVFAFVALSLGSTGSFAYTAGCPDAEAFPLNGCSLPGLGDGSFPYFTNVVANDYRDKGDRAFAIRAKDYKGSVDNYLVVDGTTNYLIDKPKYDPKASVDGEAPSGTLKMRGSIDGEKFTVTADLAGDWNSSADRTLWGFNATKIECSELINKLTGGCTTDEAVYLNLLEAIGPRTGFDRICTTGRALTSVPVPAAAWLFGWGLLGLAGMARRWKDSRKFDMSSPLTRE